MLALTVTQRYDVRLTGLGLKIPKLRAGTVRPRGDRLMPIEFSRYCNTNSLFT
jgi:hypothetical protein